MGDTLPVQLLEMCGNGSMEINNLVKAMKPGTPNETENCPVCATAPCAQRGVPTHLPLPPEVEEIRGSNDAFHKGSASWKLSGNGCFNLQNKFIHLDVTLVPSKVKTHCKLILTLKSCETCPQECKLNTDEIKKAFVMLFFMDDKMKIVNTQYIAQLDKIKENELASLDGLCCSLENFKKICQKNPEGTTRQSSTHGPISKEYEFATVYVKLGILLEPKTTPTMTFLNSPHCKNGVEQLEAKIKIRTQISAALAQSEIEKTSKNEIELDGNRPEMADVDFLEYQNQPTSTSTGVTVTQTALHKTPFSSKFSNIVHIKCGPKLEYSLAVHRHILTDKSPILRQKLTSDPSKFEMPDVSPDIVEALISFLYEHEDTQWIKQSVELMIGVLELAHKYQMTDLITHSAQLVIARNNESLTITTALKIYACGYKLDMSDLQYRALQWFNENKETVSEDEKMKAMGVFLKMESEAAVSIMFRLHNGYHLYI